MKNQEAYIKNEVYPTEIIGLIQQYINKDKYTLKTFETFADLPSIVYSNGIKITLLNNNDIKDAMISYDMGISKQYSHNIMSMGLFKFYRKDYKKDNASRYKELHIELNNATTIVILARELSDDELIETKKIKTNRFESYTITIDYKDIQILDKWYSIIKMFVENKENYILPSRIEKYNKLAIETEYIMDPNSKNTVEFDTDNTDEFESDNIGDSENSVMLF